MSFYKEIQPFVEYIHSIRKLKNYFSFDMRFPSKWVLPKSYIEETEVVMFDIQDDNYKGISFLSEIKDQHITEILNKIAKIIKINQEKEIKEKLFRETIDKLKQTFEKTDLEKLKNLYFDFQDDEPKLDVDEKEHSGHNVEVGTE